MARTSRTPSAYESITARIIEAIEQGAGPFVMPWHGDGSSRPVNAVSGKPYSGGNVVGLWAEQMLRGYGSPHWATYRQWATRGAQVRKGQRGAPIIFYKPTERMEDDERSSGFVMRSSIVFNLEQVEGGYPQMTTVPAAETLDEVDLFVWLTKARIEHGGTRAYFDPGSDYIAIPEKARFIGSPTSSATECYYSTLLHELVHWTGAEHRLNRTFGERFGDAAYAAEELVAELGAAFLCADLGVTNDPRPDHAAYVASWLKILRSDSRAIFTAASLSTAAVTYLHEKQIPF